MKNETEKLILECSKVLYKKRLVNSLYKNDFCNYIKLSRQTVYICCKNNKLSKTLSNKINEILNETK